MYSLVLPLPVGSIWNSADLAGTAIEILHPSSLPCMPIDLDLISSGLTDGTVLALALHFSFAYLCTTCFYACPWCCW
jgi:hypothetical protein